MKIEETTGKSLDPNNMLSLYIHILFNYLIFVTIQLDLLKQNLFAFSNILMIFSMICMTPSPSQRPIAPPISARNEEMLNVGHSLM